MSAKLLKEIKYPIKDHGPIGEIVELYLEQLGITEISNDIKKTLEKAKNLEILLLGENELENVDNMPDLGLTVLDLNSNKYRSNYSASMTMLL